MKTRVISAAVIIAIVGAFLVLGFTVSPYFITAFLIFLSVAGAYELLHRAAGIESRLAYIGGMIATGLMTLFSDINVMKFMRKCAEKTFADKIYIARLFKAAGYMGRLYVSVAFFLFAAFVILAKHKEFDLAKTVTFAAFPKVLSLGFSCMGRLVEGKNGVYHLFLLVTFACICDTGAYFVGVFAGKHKLCPEISPKKTVEGAIGGIVSTVVVTVIIVLIFNSREPMSLRKIISTVILSMPLSIIGMAGDLFASQIKRSVGLKDYSDLIPGHGGILDRFDSMLLIAPAFYMLNLLGAI